MLKHVVRCALWAFGFLLLGACETLDEPEPKPHLVDITCYSGAQVIYRGKAETTDILTGTLIFTDHETGRRINTTGHCVVEY